MYVTLVPRGNKTLRLGATLPASLRALASFLEADAGSTVRVFMIPGLYITPPVTSCSSFGLITRYLECGHAEGVPKASDAASHSLKELGLHT